MRAVLSEIGREIERQPVHWLVTGAAGFIGSNIVERLLRMGQTVTGVDDFSTGYKENLNSIHCSVGDEAWARFSFVSGDIRQIDVCHMACKNAQYVLHQAALGSVPRSIDDPVATNSVNVDGFMNVLVAAREANVSRVVYASSSSVYGDDAQLPKYESRIGRPLSPYAATKLTNELYADAFASCYGLETIGLRYFNVFGPRQDPDGAYAAVIPRWFKALLSGQAVQINGDGETSRDYCFVENAVQANILAAVTRHPDAPGKAYNVACGQRTTLNELFLLIRDLVAASMPAVSEARPVHGEERPGDVRHSLADISRAQELLGYRPTVQIKEGLQRSAHWYGEASQ